MMGIIPKPIVKWVGGKSQIIGDVLAAFPAEMHHYHEPFLGGGSVLLGMLSRRQSGDIKVTGTVFASDVNRNLIAMYINVQQNVTELLTECAKLADEFNGIVRTDAAVNRKAATLQQALTSKESYYYWIRSVFNAMSRTDTASSPRVSAMFVFLNKTCFRGVYREGPTGFNVPYGNYANPGIADETHLRSVSELIQGVVFSTDSYVNSLKLAEPGDFVYMDPPYVPMSKDSFVSYTKNGFSLENHRRVLKECHALGNKRIRFAMSNAHVAMVTDAFPPDLYEIIVIFCRRTINSKNPASKTNEVLIKSRW